ncbi:MAG: hypothetical protein ABII82_20795 [Verrucomicrobiota bacterium]
MCAIKDAAPQAVEQFLRQLECRRRDMQDVNDYSEGPEVYRQQGKSICISELIQDFDEAAESRDRIQAQAARAGEDATESEGIPERPW